MVKPFMMMKFKGWCNEVLFKFGFGDSEKDKH